MLKHVSPWVLVGVALFASTAWAANWNYHPDYNGTLTVHGTINCVPFGDPLFEGPVVACNDYQGSVPFWANDYQIKFVDAASCGNGNEQYKVVVRWWHVEMTKWELFDLAEWMRLNIGNDSYTLPVIADLRDEGLELIYSVVDLDVWMADPRPLQDTYDIVDGTCPDLPGFLIGTTLITFDPEVGEGENPFQTTPLTGPVNLAGDLTLDAIWSPAVSEWGMLVLALFLLTGVTIAYSRRRRAAA